MASARLSQPRILIVTHYFPPCAASGAFRLLGFARHLPALGWNVRVLCPGATPLEPVDHELTKELPGDVMVDEVPYTLGRTAALRARLSVTGTFFEGRSVWVKPAVQAGADIVSAWQPDVILTSGPPHSVHAVGHALKRQFGTPWAADLRDPWIAGSWWKVGRRRLQARAEQVAMDAADLIIANAPNALAAMMAAYPHQAKKLIVIPNGFDPEAFPEKNRQHPQRTGIRLVHTGELYAGRNPALLLQAITSLLTSGRKVVLRLVGGVDTSDRNGAEWLGKHASRWSKPISFACSTLLAGESAFRPSSMNTSGLAGRSSP